MAWLPTSYPPAPPLPIRSLSTRYQLKIILLTLLTLVCILGFFASFSLVILFAPKPELADWSPPGIKCATCGEIVRHDVDLALRLYSIGSSFKVGEERNEVIYRGLKRCWVLLEGENEWLNGAG